MGRNYTYQPALKQQKRNQNFLGLLKNLKEYVKKQTLIKTENTNYKKKIEEVSSEWASSNSWTFSLLILAKPSSFPL